MKQAILRDRHFYIWLSLFAASTIFYYFGELINLFGWETLRWDIFYTVHDPHRMLFLLPILYSSYYYRLRGALLANIISLIIFLPRAFFISPYPDATLRMVAFVILAIVISMLVVFTFNERDKGKNSTAALKQTEERYRSLIAASRDAIMTLEPPSWAFTSGNPATIEMFRARDEADFLSYAPWTLSPEFQPDGRASSEKAGEMIDTAIREGANSFEWVHRRINGEEFFADVLLSRVQQGEKIFLHALIRDMNEHKKAEEALRSAEKKYRLLVENINDIFYMLDNGGNITYISPAVERITMYKVSELIGKPVFPLIHPDDLPGLLETFNHLVSGQLVPWEFRLLDKDGRIIFVRTSRQLLYKDEKVIGITAVMTDITERKQMEQKLEEMATHDFLTGLPNRVLLLDHFTVAAALAHRNKGRLAVMSLDLDKFKTINDTLGHDAGDQVLKLVSTRLTSIIRASDTLARVGGDEFILVTMETNQLDNATAIAQKILNAFADPLSIDGHQLHLSTSIGIAIYPEDAEDMETLTKKSDAAMYYSKGHGRNQFKFFGDGDVRISGDHKSAPN